MSKEQVTGIVERGVNQLFRIPIPTDYIGGTCEGWRASPSNPNHTGKTCAKDGLIETVIFRCTVTEKAELVAKARAAGLPNATLMREALGLVTAKRRKPIPRVDPKLTTAIYVVCL